MHIETRVTRYLGTAIPDTPATAIVPSPRPERLITVERTGGGIENQLDHPTVAVQSWAPTFEEAEALATQVDAAMRDMPFGDDSVFGVEATTFQRWADPDSGSPRYQGLYTLTTTI